MLTTYSQKHMYNREGMKSTSSNVSHLACPPDQDYEADDDLADALT